MKAEDVDREEIRRLLKEAAYHKAAMWDALRGLEAATEKEINESELIDCLAGDAPSPASSPNVTDEDIDLFLDEIKDNG